MNTVTVRASKQYDILIGPGTLKGLYRNIPHRA